MNTFDVVPQFSKMLKNIDQWLEKAVAHAAAKKFDANVLLQARLAPDMYPLVNQIQSACDAAKFTAAYLTGKTAPKHPDTETTMEQIRDRIRTVAAHLETYKAEDFAGCEERKVAPPWLQGKWLRGDHYAMQMALPNFYFHVTTAYAILRHNGVNVGKLDFIGPAPFREG